jgi:hypothetical protein
MSIPCQATYSHKKSIFYDSKLTVEWNEPTKADFRRSNPDSSVAGAAKSLNQALWGLPD